MYTLSKEFRFEAAHQLIHHDGKCARRHGHSWKGTVICKGEELHKNGPKEGMLIDYGDISNVVKPIVEAYLDHWDLNETLKTEMPTSEYVARWMYDTLKGLLPNLYAVVIEETCTSRCEYTELDVNLINILNKPLAKSK